MTLSSRTTPSAVPSDDKLRKRLRDAVYAEYLSCSTDRQGHIDLVNGYWDDFNLTPYRPEQMILAEQQSLKSPLTRGRVRQIHGSLYGALALEPFFKGISPEGEDGTPAIHVQAAVQEELGRGEFENAFDLALKQSLVGTLGMFKNTVIQGKDGEPRINVDAVDARDLFLSPHNVQDIAECNMVAHRYAMTLGWLRDNAAVGVFDPEAVKKVGGGDSHPWDDANSTDRDQLGLTSGVAGPSDESKTVMLLEAYIRIRPTKKSGGDVLAPDLSKPMEWWRIFCDVTGWALLRAERWFDPLPFVPLRHERGNATMYAPAVPATLRDLQYQGDMLLSMLLEQDRMAATAIFEVQETSPVMALLKKRQISTGGAVRIKPGEILPMRGQASGIKVTQLAGPVNSQVDARLNRLSAMAGEASIPSFPQQTYRSATENKYAMAAVTSIEGQMLKVLRADLTREADVIKALYWRYIAVPYAPGVKIIRHGNKGYIIDEQTWQSVTLTPTGMTTSADQMLQMQTSGEVMGLVMQALPQKPMFVQAGIWPLVYNALRYRLKALDVREIEDLIGPPPETDKNLLDFTPQQMQASMALAGLNSGNGGGNPMDALMGGAQGGEMNGQQADPGATVMPGGNPGNGQGPTGFN